jgi:hypothetical protein
MVVASLVSNAIQGAGYQVAFQAAGQTEPIRRLDEICKYFLYNVFCCVYIACQHNCEFKQMTMILVIDPPQGFATSPLEFPDKQLIFHYYITHRKRHFYICFKDFFSNSQEQNKQQKISF